MQKFGKYTGNGGADGPFVELGFRPVSLFGRSWVLMEELNVEDSARSPINPVIITSRLNTNEILIFQRVKVI